MRNKRQTFGTIPGRAGTEKSLAVVVTISVLGVPVLLSYLCSGCSPCRQALLSIVHTSTSAQLFNIWLQPDTKSSPGQEVRSLDSVLLLLLSEPIPSGSLSLPICKVKGLH